MRQLQNGIGFFCGFGSAVAVCPPKSGHILVQRYVTLTLSFSFSSYTATQVEIELQKWFYTAFYGVSKDEDD